MGNLKYKRYVGTVEYSEDDNCLFGKVLGMTKDTITYEGNTIEELKSDFENAIDAYLESCVSRGVEPRKSYTGVLNVRLSPDLHSQLAAIAQRTGTTINALIKGAVAEYTKNAL
ncbi:MAG: type II toxin-antitoxin system HicB family antitoxin [Mucinivorans sp.]